MFLVVIQLLYVLDPPGPASALMLSLGGERARLTKGCRGSL